MSSRADLRVLAPEVRRDGQLVRRYAARGGELRAEVVADRVRLRRGEQALGATLAELRALLPLWRAWEDERTRWAAYYSKPLGGAVEWVYQPAGRKRRITLGRADVYRRRTGEELRGADHLESVAPPRSGPTGFSVVAEIVRRGELRGDPAGERVGVVYEGLAWRVEARRRELTLTRGGERLRVTSRERGFLPTMLGGALAEGEVINAAMERAQSDKWAAPSFVLIWFLREFAGAPTVRLTIDHMSPVEVAKLSGWEESRPGRWRKTVPLAALAAELAAVGCAYQAE